MFMVTPIIMLIPYLRFILLLTREKENKTKEFFMIMGLTHSDYFISWLVYIIIITLVISTVMVLISQVIIT